MKLLNKAERKFGKFAISHLMRYVLALYVIGILVSYMGAYREVDIYTQWLMLDIDKVLAGQVWRLVTFLIQPPDTSLIFLVFFLYLYYMIGEALENAWGSFIFNLYFLAGVIFNILSVVLIYVVTKSVYGVGYSYPITLTFINQSLFLAFAALYPEVRLLLFFFIPIKIKWLGILEGALMAYDVVKCIIFGISGHDVVYIAEGVAIIVAMANFLIFFLMTRNYRRISPKEMRRRANFHRTVERTKRETGQAGGITTISRHKCAICGKTEKDGDDLDFRFCSKCTGNYEYCSEHLYTHTHVGYSAPVTEVFRDCEVDENNNPLN